MQRNVLADEVKSFPKFPELTSEPQINSKRSKVEYFADTFGPRLSVIDFASISTGNDTDFRAGIRCHFCSN